MEPNNNENLVDKLKQELKDADEVKEPSEPTLEEKIQAILLSRKQNGFLSLKDDTELRLLRKQSKAVKSQREYFQKVMKQWRRNDENNRNQLLRRVRVVAKILGKENFEMLKDLYTVNTPEQRNDTGEVTAQSSSIVNYKGLLVEAKHAICLEREARIKSGNRSRKSGNSSERRAHKILLNFLTKRNAEELVKQTQETKE